jgi:Integrase zinc binding domain
VKKIHKEVGFKGVESMYYELKKKHYWPGVKEIIVNVIKECEICQENNRKNRGGFEFITISRPYEKVAIDLMDIRF